MRSIRMRSHERGRRSRLLDHERVVEIEQQRALHGAILARSPGRRRARVIASRP